MMKKALSVLLAMILLFCAAPLVYADADGEVWLIYYEYVGEDAFAAVIVAPAKYTRLSDDPRIETVYTDSPAASVVSTPAAEQIQFYWDGGTQTRWALKAVCEIGEYVPAYNIKLAVLPGSVLDDAGNGNARVYFEDEVNYLPAGGFAEIDVCSGLLLCDYGREDGTVAVGDVLRVEYSGLYPVDILINGEKVVSFPGGEGQRYSCDVAGTGALSVAVLQGGEEKEVRSLTVITSKEMYERNLRDGLITGEDIPTSEDLVQVGVPQGSPFIPLAKLIAFFVGLRDFLYRLFSFTRIAD